MIGPMATALNALSNGSGEDVSARDVVAILASGDGPGHLVRALFGDCAFETLDSLAAEAGLSRAALRASYANARRLHAARNAEFEEA